MLTVKHIAVSGHETIWPATRVSYQPKLARDKKPAALDCDSSGDIPATIFIDRMSGERGLLDTLDIGAEGSFYVMNEQGKTIAKYDLGTVLDRMSAGNGTITRGGPIVGSGTFT